MNSRFQLISFRFSLAFLSLTLLFADYCRFHTIFSPFSPPSTSACFSRCYFQLASQLHGQIHYAQSRIFLNNAFITAQSFQPVDCTSSAAWYFISYCIRPFLLIEYLRDTIISHSHTSYQCFHIISYENEQNVIWGIGMVIRWGEGLLHGHCELHLDSSDICFRLSSNSFNMYTEYQSHYWSIRHDIYRFHDSHHFFIFRLLRHRYWARLSGWPLPPQIRFRLPIRLITPPRHADSRHRYQFGWRQ
jgi:hypothetical protein